MVMTAVLTRERVNMMKLTAPVSVKRIVAAIRLVVEALALAAVVATLAAAPPLGR